MANILEKILQDLGLSEKETKVYLACLGMGEAAPADIAKHSGINRATTYVISEKLTKDGLMSQLEKDKKIYFSSESPEQLLRLLRKQEQEVKNKEQEFKKYLPELQAIFDTAGERPKVRFFEGKEGLLTMQDSFLKIKDKNIEAVYNVDDYNNIFSHEEQKKYYQTRINKKIHTRVLYNRKSGAFDKIGDSFTKARFIPENDFPFSSDISIFKDRVAIASLKGKLVGVVIENKEIANTLQSLFNLCWESSEKYQK